MRQLFKNVAHGQTSFCRQSIQVFSHVVTCLQQVLINMQMHVKKKVYIFYYMVTGIKTHFNQGTFKQKIHSILNQNIHDP